MKLAMIILNPTRTAIPLMISSYDIPAIDFRTRVMMPIHKATLVNNLAALLAYSPEYLDIAIIPAIISSKAATTVIPFTISFASIPDTSFITIAIIPIAIAILAKSFPPR